MFRFAVFASRALDRAAMTAASPSLSSPASLSWTVLAPASLSSAALALAGTRG